MRNRDVFAVSDDGSMLLAGHDVRDLVREYGSPLVVMLEDLIRANCRAYVEQIERYGRARVYYASKAFLTTGFCRLIESEGLHLDVASAGELHTALSAGFPPERILMHGNAKTVRDLTMALEAGIGRIVIDNDEEIDRLANLTATLGKKAKVFIRVTPGVKPSTHAYVQTGQVDSKFGFNLENGAAEAAAKAVMGVPGLELVGLHCHIGSQVLALQAFSIAARAMMEFYVRLKKEHGAPLDELNMGGGLGIKYTLDDYPPTVEEHLTRYRRVIREACEEYDVEPPVLCDEPGRSIVGRAGVTLYTVQTTKRIPGVRNYVSVDGGMTDNPRFALYNSSHQAFVANKMNEDPTETWSISGRCCESGDMLQKDVRMPPMQTGDIIAMLSTGAYTYSMASHYNRIARPAVVLVAPGRSGLLAAREPIEDLTRLDQIPEWLA